jgi:alkyl hydroperoxide reductase subunit AhpF
MDAMPILTESDRDAVRKEFERLAGPVKLTVFSQELVAADACRQTEWLVREVAELTDKAEVEIVNPAIDREKARAYSVEDVPAIAVEGAKDFGIRFFGVPSGYEFSNLIDAMIVASSGVPDLSSATMTALAGVAKPVHIQVFSTPT